MSGIAAIFQGVGAPLSFLTCQSSPPPETTRLHDRMITRRDGHNIIDEVTAPHHQVADHA